MTKTGPVPVSYGYQKISLKEAKCLSVAWLDKSLPESQWRLVAPIMARKKVPEVARPVIKAVKQLQLSCPRILDVGCSSGFYYDFFKWADIKNKYAGCDVSPHFIALAKKKHWLVDFRTAPITKLPYKDSSFEVVLASGILHYELNYQQALGELARVASSYVLLHRLPVFETNINNSNYKKIGYGVEMPEIVFALKTLGRLFFDSGLVMQQYWPGNRLDIRTPARWTTILLEKNLP